MPGFVLVDGNSLAHAHDHVARLSVGNLQTQAIFGVVKAVRSLFVSYPDRKILVLWDGRAAWRRELWPDYKGNRKANTPAEEAQKKAYSQQIPILQLTLERLGVQQLLNYEQEADDLAGMLVSKLPRPILLVTGDRDWCQLVQEGVDWFDPRNDGKKITSFNFMDMTGYKTPRAFLEGKALQGDASDNIPGVGGIGEKGAPELLALYGSVDAFREHARKHPNVRMKALRQLAGGSEKEPNTYPIFQRNLALMNLLDPRPIDLTKQHAFVAAFNPPGVRSIFERLAFVSLLRDFDNFIQPFASRAVTLKEAA